MIDSYINLGQVVISVLLLFITVIGYFIKKDIESFGKRLDKHDEMLFNLAGSVQRLMGQYEYDKFVERRTASREQGE